MQFIPRNKTKRTKGNSASTEKPDLFRTFFIPIENDQHPITSMKRKLNALSSGDKLVALCEDFLLDECILNAGTSCYIV